MSGAYRDWNKSKFTGEMIAADVGQFAKHSHRKVTTEMLEISGEFAVLVHIHCQEGEGSSLHLVIGQSVHELSLRLIWNVGPTCGIVGVTH